MLGILLFFSFELQFAPFAPNDGATDVAVTESKLILFGEDFVSEYDPVTDAWADLNPMKTSRTSFVVAHLK